MLRRPCLYNQFDPDGTLTDPGTGIMNNFAYSIRSRKLRVIGAAAGAVILIVMSVLALQGGKTSIGPRS